LPEPKVSADRIRPSLYINKGELNKALKLSERTLLSDLQYLLMDIMSMHTVKKKQGSYDEALALAESYRSIVKMFGNHMPSGADMMVNVYILMGDTEKALPPN
jgi:hypothetical protein